MPLVDRSLEKELQLINPELYFKWMPRVEKWAVMRKDSSSHDTTMDWVEEPDGSYRPLDNRIIESIRQQEHWLRKFQGCTKKVWVKEQNAWTGEKEVQMNAAVVEFIKTVDAVNDKRKADNQNEMKYLRKMLADDVMSDRKRYFSMHPRK